MTTPDEETAVHTPSSVAGFIRAIEQRETRFTPGTILLDRYRVINLIGRGGMGEVYRADDIKLGQQVALKFIPRELANDPRILRQLYSEVRIGREVAHPNVCKLYDIGEFEGDHFIAMQYVDGEDLASLLRRIGRLPVEKAVDIARDLAAGLVAAHDRGVIHRDLKPANVMIDGRGRAHITDFGLAILSNEVQTRGGVAGTPAYMAPEQLAGQPVTPAADLYSLGLVIYEVLTGRRLFGPGTITEISLQHHDPKPRLRAAVRDVPAPLESIVMSCLEEDPELRPSSARAILLAMPGGDPLAAALAAGETPSPEMVAASTKTGAVRAPLAYGAIALFIVVVAGIAALNPRTTFFSADRVRKTPDALSDRAEELVRLSGIRDEPFDRAEFFIDRKRAFSRTFAERDRMVYVYRRAAAPIAPANPQLEVSLTDPPLTKSKSAIVQQTGDGRLISFASIAETPPVPAAIEADAMMFRAAGFDRKDFHAVPPRFVAPVGSDQRFAWDGPAHIEAASYGGSIVWFEVNPIPPTPSRAVAITGLGGVVWSFNYIFLVAISMILGVRNLRRGRGDPRGAVRGAMIAMATGLIANLFKAHLTRVSMGLQFSYVMSQAVYSAFVFLIIYLAAEPYVRRHWPAVLISWQRLASLQWRDSLVARDAALGLLAGALSALGMRLAILAAGRGVPETPPVNLLSLSSLSQTVAWFTHAIPEAMCYAIVLMFVLLLFRVFLKHRAIYFPLFALMLAFAMSPRTGDLRDDVAFGVVNSVLLLFAIHEGGLLTVFFAWFTYHLFEGLPLTLETSTWFAPRGIIVALALIAIVAMAFAATVERGRNLANAPAAT